ncbi:hypothetical protein [Mycolicibacterium goodii]|uniref:Membrane protein n=1 Tax=Mycolicibacterium goodii TaxID=134601 RepID=A0A0K0X366_MYCGD|nr:membrane protein [Mycolicibacterium goodii]
MRRADRLQAWTLVTAVLLTIAAIYPAAHLGHAGYAGRAQAIAAEAAARHPIEATALAGSTIDPTLAEATTPASFHVRVQWNTQSGVRQALSAVDHPVKAGDKVRIWLDDKGAVTSAPKTDSDARIAGIGAFVFAWLAMVVLIGGGYAAVHVALTRRRNREWDQGLRELVH